MKLIVIRHGQTKHNAHGRLQGQRSNESLNLDGANEVRVALEKISEHRPLVLYSSPLKRARETADIIAKEFGLSVTERNELMERDFGSLTGLTWNEVANMGHTKLRELDKSFAYDYRQFGGENVDNVRSRIKKLLKDFSVIHTDETIACVTHGGIIRILYDVLEVEQPETTANASVHVFEIENFHSKNPFNLIKKI